MKKSINSYLWIPDIMRLSGFFENFPDNGNKKISKDNTPNCSFNKKSCPLSKTKFVKGTGRYVYWNYKPKMIIDLDWIELNSKHPINVIQVGKRKK